LASVPGAQVQAQLSQPQGAADLQVVQLGEHQVQDDRVWPLAARFLHGLLAVSGHDHLVVGLFQVVFQNVNDGRFVVYDQDPGGYAFPLKSLSGN
jgi:hypothetical protein